MRSFLRILGLLVAVLSLVAARAQNAALKPGYNVMVELHYNEQGLVEDAKILSSEDPTGDRMLDQIVLNMAVKDKQPPKLVDGKPTKFKARRPFNFPVEGDEGPTQGPTPRLRGDQVLPAWPDALAAKGETGGAIVELFIRADGSVKSTRVLRASHPEFAAAAEAAVKQWKFYPNDTPGAPAEARWNVAISFTLQDRPADLKWRLAPRPSLGSFTRARVVAPPAESSPAAAATEKK